MSSSLNRFLTSNLPPRLGSEPSRYSKAGGASMSRIGRQLSQTGSLFRLSLTATCRAAMDNRNARGVARGVAIEDFLGSELMYTRLIRPRVFRSERSTPAAPRRAA